MKKILLVSLFFIASCSKDDKQTTCKYYVDVYTEQGVFISTGNTDEHQYNTHSENVFYQSGFGTLWKNRKECH